MIFQKTLPLVCLSFAGSAFAMSPAEAKSTTGQAPSKRTQAAPHVQPASLKSNVVFANPKTLKAVLESSRLPAKVVLKAGLYKNLGAIVLTASGTRTDPIIIEAEAPGKVVVSGKTAFVIKGQWIVFKNLFFNQIGPVDSTYRRHVRTKVFQVLADHIRISGCVFKDSFSKPVGSEYNSEINRYPKYLRVDHCTFLRPSTKAPELFKDRKGRYMSYASKCIDADNTIIGGGGGENQEGPLYTRVDHCYMATDSSVILFGRTGKTDGGCIVDANLILHQRGGDKEQIVAKMGGSLYLNNTFLDSYGQLSLRGGGYCYMIGNTFIRGFHGSGALVAWSPRHVIVGNYFKSLRGNGTSRHGDSIITLNEGISGVQTAHDAATEAIIAYNTFETIGAPAIAFSYKSREVWAADRFKANPDYYKGHYFTLPLGTQIIGNYFHRIGGSPTKLFSRLYSETLKTTVFKDNLTSPKAYVITYPKPPAKLFNNKRGLSDYILKNASRLSSPKGLTQATKPAKRNPSGRIPPITMPTDFIKGLTQATKPAKRNASGRILSPITMPTDFKVYKSDFLPLDMNALVHGSIILKPQHPAARAGMDLRGLGDLRKIANTRALRYKDVGAQWFWAQGGKPYQHDWVQKAYQKTKAELTAKGLEKFLDAPEP